MAVQSIPVAGDPAVELASGVLGAALIAREPGAALHLLGLGRAPGEEVAVATPGA